MFWRLVFFPMRSVSTIVPDHGDEQHEACRLK
jgi:hypothetical protein